MLLLLLLILSLLRPCQKPLFSLSPLNLYFGFVSACLGMRSALKKNAMLKFDSKGLVEPHHSFSWECWKAKAEGKRYLLLADGSALIRGYW